MKAHSNSEGRESSFSGYSSLGRYVNGKILQQATNYRSHSKLAGLLDVRNIFLTCKQQVPNWLWG